MSEDVKRVRRRVTMVLVGLPFLITFFVVGGVFLGFYLSDISNTPSRVVLPLLFATTGLAVSIIASYFIAKKVSYPGAEVKKRKDR